MVFKKIAPFPVTILMQTIKTTNISFLTVFSLDPNTITTMYNINKSKIGIGHMIRVL